jgi:hypothetical protein
VKVQSTVALHLYKGSLNLLKIGFQVNLIGLTNKLQKKKKFGTLAILAHERMVFDWDSDFEPRSRIFRVVRIAVAVAIVLLGFLSRCSCFYFLLFLFLSFCVLREFSKEKVIFFSSQELVRYFVPSNQDT